VALGLSIQLAYIAKPPEAILSYSNPEVAD